MSLIFFRISQSIILLILDGSIQILFSRRTYLRNSTFYLQNSYLSRLTLVSALSSLSSTRYTYFLYSPRVREKIKISSRYTTTKLSKYSRRTLLIKAQKVVGTFISPKGITVYSNRLYLVRNAIFYSSPSFILIRLYTPLRLTLVN